MMLHLKVKGLLRLLRYMHRESQVLGDFAISRAQGGVVVQQQHLHPTAISMCSVRDALFGGQHFSSSFSPGLRDPRPPFHLGTKEVSHRNPRMLCSILSSAFGPTSKLQ